MKRKIKQVTIITQHGVGITQIGYDGVAEIRDCSNEYSDHTEFIYQAFDADGKLLKSIINCPVDIDYE